MDDKPAPPSDPAGPPRDPDHRSEVERASWLTAVSGGSYMATAWVTARDAIGDDPVVPAWSRRSPEEDHLRRRASYLAPGLGGKLWALLRFLLGFTVNAGMVVLAAAVVFTPAGWLIDTSTDPQPSSGGSLVLADGGCVQLPGGQQLVIAPGEKVQTSSGEELVIGEGSAIKPAKKGDEKATATVEGGKGIAVAIGTGGTASAPAGSTPPKVAQPPCRPEDPVSGGAPAAVQGRRLEAGIKVPLDLSRPLKVQSGGVSACVAPGAQASSDAEPCSDEKAFVTDLPKGSRLMAARSATLELEHASVVVGAGAGSARLSRACGLSSCEQVDMRDGIDLLWMVPGLLTLAFGIALVVVRHQEGARSGLERFVRRSAVATVLAGLAVWVLPRIVVTIEHTKGWLEDGLHLAPEVGTGTLLLALFAQIGAGTEKDAAPAAKATALAKRAGARLRPLLVKFAGAIVGPLLVILIVLSFTMHGASRGFEAPELVWLIPVLALLFWLGSGGDLNEWSLHPFYRERLRSAFAVDPRVVSPLEPLPAPRTDPLEELDDISPRLVICAAANIADDRITAPGRPVVSWTFARDLIGSSAITAATSDPFNGTGLTGTYAPGDLPDGFRHLASAWTAVAVSGAAFSPAMGKMSRPERFLMALGNLRLGVWYPNPRYNTSPGAVAKAGDFDRDWYALHHPRPWYLVKEALGLHRLRDPWVYVTDGGHYENLGLVELLRRRCTEIYCFDAAGDATNTFGTLADAMRLAREEMDIEIDIRPTPLAPGKDDDGISHLGVWAGTVHYRDPDEVGWLVIAKLTVPRGAPFDVIDLARTLPSFPTHPTADQLYTDQKFEAYRALGHHLGEQARLVGTTIRDLHFAYGDTVEKAVSTVDAALCALKDPAPCPKPTGDEPAKG
jgi:hypothetical protein